MQALLVTTDLMATASAQGDADRAGVDLRIVSAAAATETADAETGLVAIDLSGPIADIGALVASLKAAAPAATLIAYGPHVHEAKLAAAQEAGCDRVLSRGQFYRGFGQILAGYAAEG